VSIDEGRGYFVLCRNAAVAGVLGVLLAISPTSTRAAPVTLEGLTFSDELGGFQIVSGSGRGSSDDPFVLVEEVSGPQPPILVIRGLTVAFGNRVHTHHVTGFALTKVAVNLTGERWVRYHLELREVLADPSPYGDGLSFGQASVVGKPFASTTFADTREVDEPFDSVMFENGAVAPGSRAAFAVVITDMSPQPVFYLAQEQQYQVAGPACGDGAAQWCAAAIIARLRSARSKNTLQASREQASRE